MTCSYCRKNPAVRKAAAGKLVICGPCRLVRLVRLRGQRNDWEVDLGRQQGDNGTPPSSRHPAELDPDKLGVFFAYSLLRLNGMISL